VQIKAKLEAIANVTVIAVALVVGYVLLKDKVAGPRLPQSIAAGDRLAALPGLDWSGHRRTLVLALNSGCHYCQDSVPFYQRLVQAVKPNGDDLEIVAVFPNDAEAVQQLMKQESLAMRSIPTVPLEKLGVAVTPTLVLVGRGGRVERFWAGLLSPRQELEVLSLVSGSTEDCSASELSALQMTGNKSCGSSTNDQTKN
jgi:thiol-disulfide isomerase/thioredoxin